MNRKDYTVLFTLSFLALFIWIRDLEWMSSTDDTLPILICIPLFAWLEWPWKLLDTTYELRPTNVLVASVLLLAGVISNLTILLTIAWCYLLWTWIKQRTPLSLQKRLSKLMILPIMAFPWVTLDAYIIGWWFRLSGAWVATQFFSLINLSAVQQGTAMVINGVPISVDVSCAGLNTLQSMLIAGSVLAYIQLGNLKRYWLNIPFLIWMAWLANTLRIIMLCSVAVGISTEFAMGPFHESGGWVVLFLMFCLCWFVFSLQQPRSDEIPDAQVNQQ